MAKKKEKGFFDNKYLFFGAIAIIIILIFAFSGSSKEYQCQDGSFKKSKVLCQTISAPVEGMSQIIEKEVTKYVCSNGKVVESSNECPISEEILQNDEYEFTEINKFITQEATYYGYDDKLKVTLLKIGKKVLGEEMKLKIYFRIENIGDNDVKSLSPHQEMILITKSGNQYESGLDTMDRTEDDFKVGPTFNYNEEMRPGVFGEGGIVIDGIPSSETEFDIIWDTLQFEDFAFKDIKIN